jgi:hypothetical protein
MLWFMADAARTRMRSAFAETTLVILWDITNLEWTGIVLGRQKIDVVLEQIQKAKFVNIRKTALRDRLVNTAGIFAVFG